MGVVHSKAEATVRMKHSEQLSLPLVAPLNLNDLFRRVFDRLRIRSSITSIDARFHPFAGLRSTVRVRNGALRARVSDLLEDAAPIILEALAEILLARMFRRRPSREARECYLAYTFRPAVRARIDLARRERGTKRLLPPRGRHHNLEEIFHELNHRFFGNEIHPCRLGWSHQYASRVLGHYDSGHSAIIISRKLDSPAVPRYLVEYVVYHEMLHIKFPVERRGQRRIVHSREFREAEKKFPQFEAACRKLKNLCG